MGNANNNQNGDRRRNYENNDGRIPAAGRPSDRQSQNEEGKTQKVIVLKNHVNIRKESVKVVKHAENQFFLDMIFDANYECIITVYICATECRNASNIPLYFLTNPEHPNPNSYKFSAALIQQFPPQVCNINTSMYRIEDLTTIKEDYYPIVIMIEAVYPPSYTGRAKRSIQFTYGQFTMETPGLLKYKFIKQKFLYNNTIFDLNDIFGIDNSAANIKDDTQKECVICYTTTKDTVVLPCRHMCLCIQCSQIVRMQTID